MGNCAGSKKQPKTKYEKILTENEIEILSNQTGFSIEGVQEWYTEFMVNLVF